MTKPHERWKRSGSKGEFGTSPDVDVFLDEIEAVCRRHGMSISHEDGHGSFTIEEFRESNIEWLRDATDDRGR